MLHMLHFDEGLGFTLYPEELADRLSVQLQWDYVQEEASFWHFLETQQYQVLLVHAVRIMSEGWVEKIKGLQQTCQVVVLFRHESPPTLLAIMAAGVAELLPAELPQAELKLRLSTFCQSFLRRQAPAVLPPTMHIVGESMRLLYADLAQVERASISSILVTGESGTGKEGVATLLQSLLPSHTPFLPLNCAAMPEALLEAELFGYEKGAFTGAANKRCGILARAHRGWIFLDEVACLSLAAQAALLRVLETGEVRAIGGYLPKSYQIRVLAATNQDLDAMVRQQKFRNDLLQRLRGYEIHLAPFRDRQQEEKEEIIDHLLLRLHKECRHVSGHPYTLAPEVRCLILKLAWRHGNIREVWNNLRAMTVAAESALLTFGCLSTRVLKTLSQTRDGEPLGHTSLDSLVGFSSVSDFRAGP
jgi:DNA-binding NtrC family response regulator